MLNLIERLKEPSTYAGLGGLLALFGVNVQDTAINAISTALAALFGLAAIFMSEKK